MLRAISTSSLIALMVLGSALMGCSNSAKHATAPAPSSEAAASPIPPGAKRDPDGSYRLKLDQLPAPVRQAFEQQAAGHKIQGISLEMQDDKPVYDCDVFINGKKHELVADGDGKLLSAPIAAAPANAMASQLPDPVARTFKAAFPHARITKLDKDQENGVWVHDIEFTKGPVEQECDISADGTMLEVTLVITPKDVPAPAMNAIQKAANGGKISRIEKIDIAYETKEGKVLKLAAPETHFAAEYAKGEGTSEVCVYSDGTPAKG